MSKFIYAFVAVVFVSATAQAQSFEAGVHFASSQWSEFDGNDLGIGGRVSWLPPFAGAMLGIDADLTVYPSEFPPDTAVPFSGNRFEGLFGVTIGPRLGRVRAFGKAGAGFLQVGDTPVAFACIAIFPPPLACTLAGGTTLAAYEIGGGVSVAATPKTFVRLDVADRILKYPRIGLGHAPRVTVGGGFRF